MEKEDGVPDELFGLKVTFEPKKMLSGEALQGVVFGLRATGQAFLLEANERKQRLIVFMPIYDREAIAEAEMKKLRKQLEQNFSGALTITDMTPTTIEVDDTIAQEGMRQELALAVLSHLPFDLVQALYDHAAGRLAQAKEKVLQ